MNEALQRSIAEAIREALGADVSVVSRQAVGGGCIHRAWQLRLDEEPWSLFVKTNAAETIGMFSAEAEGLEELRKANAIRAPQPLAHGVADGSAYLVLEWLEVSSRGDQAESGRQLAALHRRESGDGRYGWHRDNVIGATPQVNDWCESWAEFFVTRRLEPQLRMAEKNGQPFADAKRVLRRAEEMLAGHEPPASLLHGDLWSGNAGFALFDGEAQPVIFDPATYFGDRETDLAFTEFFGGFGAEFYRGYAEAAPLADGYEQRRDLYNLYHVLNHCNLFGGDYRRQAEQIMGRLAVG